LKKSLFSSVSPISSWNHTLVSGPPTRVDKAETEDDNVDAGREGGKRKALAPLTRAKARVIMRVRLLGARCTSLRAAVAAS
jgi:hypothetical protein